MKIGKFCESQILAILKEETCDLRGNWCAASMGLALRPTPVHVHVLGQNAQQPDGHARTGGRKRAARAGACRLRAGALP